MKHPCKKCLVRAACSKECDIWKSYSNNAARLMTFLSIILTAIIIGPLLLWLNNIGDTTGEEWPGMVTIFIWIFSFMGATIIQAPHDKNEKIGFIGTLIFAPFILSWIVIIHLTKRYFQRA